MDMKKILVLIIAILLLVILLLACKLLDGRTVVVPGDARPVETTVETTEPTEETLQTESVPAETRETVPAETTLPPETVPQEDRFLLSFAGDCTLGSSPANYYADVGFVKTVGEDYGYPFRHVIGYLEDDHGTFVNLEGPLTDEGNPMEKNHTFRGPEAFVNILTENSVEFVDSSR